MADKIKLLLVDDHDVVRQGIKSLLEGYSNFEVLAEARDGKEAFEKAVELQPDVILMDITMPEMDGFEATKLINGRCPDCKVLALTVHEDKEFILEMIVAGASGYVTKRSLADDVVHAINAVAAGEIFLPQEFIRILVEDFRRLWSKTPVEINIEEENSDLQLLSMREKEVIQLVAQGYRSAEIGETLGITTRTISRHRERIMEKLNLNSSADLVRFAIRTGLVKA